MQTMRVRRRYHSDHTERFEVAATYGCIEQQHHAAAHPPAPCHFASRNYPPHPVARTERPVR